MKTIQRLILLLLLLLTVTVTAFAASPWAAAEVQAAEASGLVPFYMRHDYDDPATGENFRDLLRHLLPEATVPDCPAVFTWEEAAHFLRRTYDELAPASLPQPKLELLLVDTDNEALRWCVEAGLLDGCDGWYVHPDRLLTRGECVRAMVRLQALCRAQAEKVEEIVTDDGTVEKYQVQLGKQTEKRFRFEDGTLVVNGVLDGETKMGTVCTIPMAEDGFLRYYKDGAWTEMPLKEGKYPCACAYLDSRISHGWVYPPRQYRVVKKHFLQDLPEQMGYLWVEEQDGWFSVRVMAQPVAKDCRAFYLCTVSPNPLADWEDPRWDYLKNFNLDAEGRWCYDGYYYSTPAEYYPTGKDLYFRRTAAYHVKSICWQMGVFPGCDYLTQAMLHTIDDLFNDYGFIPQMNQSLWIYGDYGVAPGYFDTRWSCDLMEIYLKEYSYNHDARSRKTIETFLDFYADFAPKHSWSTRGGGWLVENYWNPGGHPMTLVALNHQLAAISVLYQAADALEREDWRALGDRMRKGITDEVELWIRTDGDLHYGFLPTKGGYGRPDYPYLTYNDLLAVQRLLPEPDPGLQRLMDTKKQWMDSHGVTGYNK